ncbi:MAG: DNRLRE domain-containing protein [Bacteroidota bacterium]
METDSTTAGTKWILFDISGPLPDNSTSNIIYPSMDAYVKGGADANSNFGASSWLVVKESSNALYDRMSFLQFDLGTISNPVTNAKIRLKVETEDMGASHNLHLVSDDSWTESGITWNNQPGNSFLISTEVVPAVDGWIEFDVTAVVNNETDGFLSVRISDANAAEDYVLYHSSEAANLDDRPQLTYELPVTQSLMPSEDTFGKGGVNSNSNYGSQSTIEVKESSNSNYDRKGYVKFDISSVSGTVSDAKLRLKVQTRDASTNHELWLVTVDTWTESGLNWTNQPSGSTLIGTQAVPASENWIEFDVTSILNNETDQFLSFQLVNSNQNEALVRYHSSEATAMEDRPQLEFTSSSNNSPMDNMETILSIGEGEPQSEIFRFYPNPAEDYIILDGAIKDSHFILSSLSGKKIMEIRLKEDINRIDISRIPKGTYLLTLRTKDGMTSYMGIFK